MRKPAVAFASQEGARQNLERKIEALKKRLEAGGSVTGLPTGPTQFNRWKAPATGDEPDLRPNAHETLSANRDLKDAVLALTAAVKCKQRPPLRPRDVSVRVAREKSDLHLAIRRVAEAAYLRVSEENRQLRRDIQGLKGQVASIADEAAKKRADYEAELERLRSLYLRHKPAVGAAGRPRR